MSILDAALNEIAAIVNAALPTDALAEATAIAELADEPFAALCDQCETRCDAFCAICGAGLHSTAHTDRHGRGECEGERNFARWVPEGYFDWLGL